MRLKLPAVLVTALLTRLPGLIHLPTPGDEVSYAAGASVIMKGGALYRDFLDHKPPLIYYTYAAVFGATSDYDLVAIHLLTMLVVAATGLAVGRIARLYLAPGTTRADLVAALLYVVFSATFVDFAALDANAELFLNLPVALALGAWLSWRGSARGALLPLATGALIAVATLYKYQAVFIVLAVAVDIVRARAFKAGALFAAGFAGPFAVVFALFAASNSLEPLWQRGILYNLQFLADAPGLSAALLALAAAVGKVVAPACVVWFFATRTSLRPSSSADRVARLWLIALLPAVAMGGRFFPHYFLVALIPLVALSARAITLALAGRHRWLIATSLGVPAVCLCAFQWARPAIARATGFAEPDLAEPASLVRAHTSPRDRIFMWGQAYPLYTLAKRTPAARLIFWGFRPDDAAAPTPGESALMAGILSDLEKHRARAIVDVGGQPFRQAPALAAYVTANYRLVATTANARVYLRLAHVDDSPPPP